MTPSLDLHTLAKGMADAIEATAHCVMKIVINGQTYESVPLADYIYSQLVRIQKDTREQTEKERGEFDMRNYEYWTGARWQIISPNTIMLRPRAAASQHEPKGE